MPESLTRRASPWDFCTPHRGWPASPRNGGRLQFGMVAGFKSESRPASIRNTWPECVGICILDAERATLAEIGHRLGRRVLGEVANVARPDTILTWYRKLVARKFDGSNARRSPGRPRIKPEVEQLIVRMAKENHDWGYDRIVGALANLGYKVCDQTVGNVLQRHALPPAPERKRTTQLFPQQVL